LIYEGVEIMKNNNRLAINFCGVEFENPFCLSSSPVSNTAEMVERAYDAGWGGVVFKTVGRDLRITHPSPRLNAYHYQEKRVVGLQNVEMISDRTLEENLKDITYLKKKYPNRVLIVSIMGLKEDDWSDLAHRCQDAGGDLLELNFSCPQMAYEGTGSDVGKDEDLIEKFTVACKKVTSIPIIAKMTPNVTDMTLPALAAKRGGADAISAINTIKCISGIDIDKFIPLPNVDGKSTVSGFSGPSAKPIGLRFISDLAREQQLNLPLSGMGGIVTWIDALHYILLGASTIQVTTSIMRYGYRIVEEMIEGLSDYMEEKGFDSIDQVCGKALENLVTPDLLNHGVEARSQIDRDLCLGCGQCYITCQDAGNQAITLGEDRKPTVDEDRCFGCLMCKHICPVWDCISYKMVARQ